MTQSLETKLDPEDKFYKLKSDNVKQMQQQYLLVFSTVQDILEEFIETQTEKDNIDFSLLDVQIEDSDPLLITMLTTELLRVLIDTHNVDFYEAAKVVSKTV